MGKRHAEAQEQDASQDQRIDDLEGQQVPTPAAAPSGGLSSESMQQLEQLGKLHEQGILTDEEFAQQKGKLLAG
jgi:Short C-terminal domain